MNDAPIQIRNPEVVRAIRRQAEKSGRPITEVVAEAMQLVEARQAEGEADRRRRKAAALEEIARRFRALPIVGPLLTDDDLYDADGLPK